MTLWQWIQSWFHPHAPAPAPAPLPSPSPIPEPIVALLDAINEVRADHHLPPFLPDAKLDAMAMNWAEAMRRNRILSHGDFMSRMDAVYPNRFGAENIAEGQRTAEEVVDSWMKSPGHRANLLGDYLHVGCGRSGTYWCVDFLK